MKNHWLNKKVRIVDIRVSSSEGVNPVWCPENAEIEFSSGHIYKFWINDNGTISSCASKDGKQVLSKVDELNIAFDRAKIVFADRLKAIEEREMAEALKYNVCTGFD